MFSPIDYCVRVHVLVASLASASVAATFMAICGAAAYDVAMKDLDAGLGQQATQPEASSERVKRAVRQTGRRSAP